MAEKVWGEKTFTPEEFEEHCKSREHENAWVADTIPLANLRMERNILLVETDWWILRGNPTQEQLDYRQALRDITKTAVPKLDKWDKVTGVEWPTKPED